MQPLIINYPELLSFHFYVAKSLLFGANGMIYNACADAGFTVFNDAQIMGYEYVGGK